MTDPNLISPRERLVLPACTPARDGASVPRKRPGGAFDHAAQIKEFAFPGGGRPVAIHRHAVLFATPLKDSRAHTLVGIKGFQGLVYVSCGSIFEKDASFRFMATLRNGRRFMGFALALHHGLRIISYDEKNSEMALAHTVGSSTRNIYKRHADAHRKPPPHDAGLGDGMRRAAASGRNPFQAAKAK